jgi:DMSO/TMAO reductase YedYZ molybdopterin-dependent catalytic subunit
MHPRLPRRRFLQLSGFSGISIFLSGCGATLFEKQIGKAIQPLNRNVQSLLLEPQEPVPEFPPSAIQPEELLINTYRYTPNIDPEAFRLSIDGEANNPLSLSMAEIQQMPFTSMVIRHVCVEGWAAIVQWGGVKLRDLVSLVQPKNSVGYIYFHSADGYLESWDIASALHPQTLMAYQKNQQPLPPENGAPLRLASPIKLGYKQSKWVTRITLVSELSSPTGTWESWGYEWYAGL